jgi:hypothetical protein
MPKDVVFSGSVRECLLHYGNNLPGKDGKRSQKARQPMAEFVHVGHYLIFRWLNNEHMPIGENLLRVMVWLYTQNYKVAEWEKLPKLAQQLILILAHDVRNLDQIQEGLGYKSRDSLMAVLRGANMAPAKIRAAQGLIARFPIKEEANKADIVELKQSTGLVDHGVIIDSLSHQIDAMLPLAKLVISEEFSVEERRQLRQQVSNDGLHTLAQVLNGLCSARSRDIVLQKQDVADEGR